MRSTTFNSAFVSQRKLKTAEKINRTSYNTSIALAVGGGLFFLLLGFLLPIIFTISGGNNAALNYAGIGSLIIAFTFLALGAHFMDKTDEDKRQSKRAGIERFNRKRLL